MRIGINTRFLLPNKMEGFGWYTFEVVKRLVEQHPEHEFVFFFDRAFDEKFIFSSNVTPVVLFPPARHPFLFLWWFNFSIKRALRKHKIDVFFSPDGYLCLNTQVPQIGVIHDLNFEHHPEDIPSMPRWYLRKYFPKFAKKAHKIITVSNYSKEDLVASYHIPEQKIIVAWNGASEKFIPLSTEKIIEIRGSNTHGKPYFIFVGALHPRKNVGKLIEAYLAFQAENSDIDLLIVGESLWKNKGSNLPELTKEQKKRIHFSGHVPLEKLTELMGAALALVYIPYFEGFGIPLVEAMRCGIPILAGNLTCLPEVAGDAAIYCNPHESKEVKDGMLRLADDSELRLVLGTNGLERSKLFSWDKSAEIVWQEIQPLSKT